MRDAEDLLRGILRRSEEVEAAGFIRIEARIAEHRHVHEIAVFQNDLVRRRAHGAVRLHRVLAVDVVDQVRAVVPEAGHIHMARAAGNGQPVGRDCQRSLSALVFAQTEAVALHRGDVKVQHRRLFDELAVFIVVVRFQAVVGQIEVFDRERHVREDGAARAGLERVVVGQGEQNLHRREVLALGVGVVLEDRDGDCRRGALVVERERLHAEMVRVKGLFQPDVVFLVVAKSRLRRRAVAPCCVEAEAAHVHLFALLIARLVRARDGEVSDIRVRRELRIIVVRALYPVSVLTLIQKGKYREVFELVRGLSRTGLCKSLVRFCLICKAVIAAAGGKHGNLTDSTLCRSGFIVEVVVLDLLHFVEASQISDDTTDIFAFAFDRAVEVAVSEPALVDAAIHTFFSAEQAADIIVTCNISVHITVDKGNCHRVGRRITVIARANQTAYPFACGFDRTFEIAVDRLAQAHALTLGTGKAAHF